MRVCLIFYRGGERFALDLEHVRRIASVRDMQQLPSPADDVEGVVPDGSHIVPVIATPLPALRADCPRPRVLLLNNGECPFGFQVEALEGPKVLRSLDRFEMSEAAETLLARAPAEAVLGVAVIAGGTPGGGWTVMASANAPQELVVVLDPAPLYRARAPEEAHERV